MQKEERNYQLRPHISIVDLNKSRFSPNGKNRLLIFYKIGKFLSIERSESNMQFSESLKKNRDFQYVYRNGRSVANRYIVMYVLENGTERNRLGISVSKKVGNSVVRHHLTRLIRESYRLNEEKFSTGLDIVVVLRTTAKDISFAEAESALLHAGRIQGIVEKSE